MALSHKKQQDTFRFGGALKVKKAIGDSRFSPDEFLQGLNENEFQQLFCEWIVQCYIYDQTELIPLAQEELEKFDINSLASEFRRNFISGDWKRIVQCSGASIDEMFLFTQMLFKQTAVYLFNGNQPPLPILPEMAKYYVIPEKVIFPIFLEYINSNHATALITDSIDYHVLNPFGYDRDRNVILYEDNIGLNGDCFLTKERNYLRIDSEFIGHDTFGNWCWEVLVEDFQKVFYGICLLSSEGDLWNQAAMKIYMEKL